MTGQKKAVVLLIVALIAAAFLAGRQVAVKMHRHIQSLDEKIAERQIQLDFAQAEVNNNKDYVRKWDTIRGFRQEPVEDLQNKFTAYLQSLETERRFHYSSLGSASGRPVEAGSEFQVLSYNVSFFANLDDLVEFVGQLDNSDKLLRIERLKITRRADYQTLRESVVPTFWSPGDLSVEMTVAIPAAKPTVEFPSFLREIKP
jgi:hypothetical protein